MSMCGTIQVFNGKVMGVGSAKGRLVGALPQSIISFKEVLIVYQGIIHLRCDALFFGLDMLLVLDRRL